MENGYAQALYKAITGGIAPKKAIEALHAQLVRENRAGLMPHIARAFARVAQREHAKDRSVLFVAREHDASHAAHEAGKYAEMKDHDTVVDSTLIGGWRLEHKDVLVDNSYKAHLLDIFNRVTA